MVVANSYDANGNVMSVSSTYPNLAGSGSVSPTTWYRYDTMNRMVIVGGAVAGGNIVRGTSGQAIAYDIAGRRVSVTREAYLTGQAWTWIWAPGYGPGSGHPHDLPGDPSMGEMGYVEAGYYGDRREEYSYRADGQLMDVSFAESGYTDNGNGTVSSTGTFGSAILRARNERDALGRVTRYREYEATGTSVTHDRYDIVYDAGDRVTAEKVSQLKIEGGTANTYLTITTNSYTNGLADRDYGDRCNNPRTLMAPPELRGITQRRYRLCSTA